MRAPTTADGRADPFEPAASPHGVEAPGPGGRARDAHTPEERVLLLLPVPRDARLASRVLERHGFSVEVCGDLRALVDELGRGAGAAIVAEEGFLAGEGVERLVAWLEAQPPWSSLPLVFLAVDRARLDRRLQSGSVVERLGNVTFLERPLRMITLVSTVRALVDGRRRQYEVRDLLERLERGVRQRDKFLAILGHELRNPMGAIRSGLEILAHRGGGREERALALRILERQTRHLSRLVDDLLDVSRVTRDLIVLDRRPVPVHEALESALEVVRPQIAERGHRLVVERPEEEVLVDADPTRLDQVLANLLSNAVKYTDPGGTIWLVGRRSGPMAEVRVRDTGIGISPDLLSRIFDMFAQTEQSQGLGLGLTLAKKLVRLHDGTIEARSEGSGKGSEFIVRLPLHGGAARRGRPAAEPGGGPAPGER